MTVGVSNVILQSHDQRPEVHGLQCTIQFCKCFVGTAYGAGVYFAVNASYSLGYCRADSNGHKHMFSVQVATGDACQGSGAMNVLPPKPGAGNHVTYDSSSDNPSNPVMYVIFHDSQAYPAYHIIFK